MEPYTGPSNRPRENPTCARCGWPLAGNRIACPPCQEAAEVAVREITDRTILPGDIAAIRERMG